MPKDMLIGWKEELLEHYILASINSMITDANRFLDFCNVVELRFRPIKLKRWLFLIEEKKRKRT